MGVSRLAELSPAAAVQATSAANQTWATWPVEFGSGQPWKVEGTVPPTYVMFAEMHWCAPLRR